VVETENQVGGLCRTIRKDDYCYDLGGHRFITKDAEIQKEIEGLMLDDLIVQPRKSVIRLQGKYFNYPLDIKDIVMKLSPLFTFRAFLDYSLTSLLQKLFPRPDSSFESWVINRFGTTLYNMYFGPYSKKLWGIPPNMISSAWADQRISLINLWDVFMRMLGKKKDEPKTYAGKFYYPKKGIGQICEKMAERVTRNGGKIHLNTQVEHITMHDNQIADILCRKNGEQVKIKGDYFISTIALPDFVRGIRPRVDEKFHAIADKMDFRSIRFLHLMIDQERITDNTWIYIPENKYLFFRIQEIVNWSPQAVPPGKTGLTLEIACNEDDEVWQAEDKQLLDRSLKNLNELGLLNDRNKVLGYFSTKAKHCYPMYTLDYFYKTNALLNLISQIKNAISIGRQGLYRYNNIDHSIKMGLLAARHIIEDYPKEEIFEVATEKKIFDWQDPGR
ncbi:MAG: hypothetical protein A2166_02635, partial [Omnitrophica WOR_2 bacterium RBG_13_41_10]